jgi:hypothetical protein
MKLRILLAAVLALLLAQPAFAALKVYATSGDNSTLFPTNGTIFRPGTLTGTADIVEPGPTLELFVTKTTFIDVVGGTTTSGIPGTTVIVDVITTAKPSPNQTGAGSTTTAISWGSLTGWTQTGRLFCKTNCPGTCGTASSCVPFVGFEGTGPPAPLKSTTFNLDPFTFTTDGASFTVPSVEFVSLGGGAVTANTKGGGTLSTVPAIPLAGLAGLGAALVYLGSRALRRKS